MPVQAAANLITSYGQWLGKQQYADDKSQNEEQAISRDPYLGLVNMAPRPGS